MIRGTNRNISVSRGHGYTVEKVKYAMDFINSSQRTKTLADWVNAYNHIKGTNETAQGCQSCKAAKYTAAVRNYAQYGYLTLLNEGHSPDEFKTGIVENNVEVKDKPTKTADVAVPAAEMKSGMQSDDVAVLQSDDEVLENALETLKKVQEVTQAEEVAEQTEQPVEKKKVGRPKKVKK